MTSAKRAGIPTTIIVVGLMLFSMFFGAGNLVFPPQLGQQAGTNYWPAILGFLSTGVVLPMLAIIAVAVSGAGLGDIAKRTGKVFAMIFPALIYLSIGAFYAIPRTANVAYEMGFVGPTGISGTVALLLFVVAFFALSLWLSLRRGGIVDALGKYLTPALLTLIVILVIVGSARLSAAPSAPSEEYASSPFTSGILEGYLTMDSLAALVFGIVVLLSLYSRGVPAGRPSVIACIMSGVVGAVLLGLVYLGLGHLGRSVGQQFNNGAELLAYASHVALGSAGSWVFSGIVLLACLTTAVGLITSTASYFATLIPAVDYRGWSIIFTIIGALMANLGLTVILDIAAPLNALLYPVAVTLIFLTLIQAALRFRLVWAYRLPVALAAVFALNDLLRSFDIEIGRAIPAIMKLPLYGQGLSWILPVAILAAICIVIDKIRGLPIQSPSEIARRSTLLHDLPETETTA